MYKSKPTISIIVPVFNVSPYLHRCIDSILAQTFTNFELILINDGSSDNSGEICENYIHKDNRAKVIHKENGGVSKARNTGLDIAIGEYITFIDSDDYVDFDYLRVMHKAISENNSDMAICGVRYRNSDNLDACNEQVYINDFTIGKKDYPNKIYSLLEKRRLNYIYSKLYRRNLLDVNRIRFDTKMMLGEDTIFVCDVLKCSERISVVGECYYNYIKYSSGTLTTKYYENIYEIYLFIAKYIEQSMLTIGCLNKEMLNVIDDRKIISADWSITSIRNQKQINFMIKIKLINLVINNKELLESLERRRDIFKQKDIALIRRGNAVLLFLYYYLEPGKLKIIGFIRRLTPNSFVRWYKKWILKLVSLFLFTM